MTLSMPTTQTTYNDRILPAQAGQIADTRTFDSITRSAEGTIAFGVAVSRGTDLEKGCVQGGTLNKFLGVSIRDITVIHTTPDQYEIPENTGILTSGTIWVQVTGSPGPGDPVKFDGTTGKFSVSGGIGPLLGARYMTTTVAPGLCKLHLGNYDQS